MLFGYSDCRQLIRLMFSLADHWTSAWLVLLCAWWEIHLEANVQDLFWLTILVISGADIWQREHPGAQEPDQVQGDSVQWQFSQWRQVTGGGCWRWARQGIWCGQQVCAQDLQGPYKVGNCADKPVSNCQLVTASYYHHFPHPFWSFLSQRDHCYLLTLIHRI